MKKEISGAFNNMMLALKTITAFYGFINARLEFFMSTVYLYMYSEWWCPNVMFC